MSREKSKGQASKSARKGSRVVTKKKKAPSNGALNRFLVTMVLVLATFCLLLYGTNKALDVHLMRYEPSGAVAASGRHKEFGEALYRHQKVRIEKAIAVHRLYTGDCPKNLKELVRQRALHESDLLYPGLKIGPSLKIEAGQCRLLEPLR